MPKGRTKQGDITRERILAEFAARTDHPPTYRELAETLHIHVTAVRTHVGILVADGKLVRQPGAHRAVRLPIAGGEEAPPSEAAQ